jgi:hypothetical protein
VSPARHVVRRPAALVAVVPEDEHGHGLGAARGHHQGVIREVRVHALVVVGDGVDRRLLPDLGLRQPQLVRPAAQQLARRRQHPRVQRLRRAAQLSCASARFACLASSLSFDLSLALSRSLARALFRYLPLSVSLARVARAAQAHELPARHASCGWRGRRTTPAPTGPASGRTGTPSGCCGAEPRQRASRRPPECGHDRGATPPPPTAPHSSEPSLAAVTYCY